MGEEYYWRATMSEFLRLNITAEGQTEERFVKTCLSDYLGNYNISTDVRNVLTSKNRLKHFRGGLINYPKARRDIQTWLKHDRDNNVFFTTMFDYYALPEDFPYFEESAKIQDPYDRVRFLEKKFEEDINDHRFIAYIQLHEFEALLFSNPEILSEYYFEYKKEVDGLIEIAKEFANPELINDKPETAPSKRIKKLIPPFNKVNIGAIAICKIGIENLMQSCKHFNDWITKLESLPNSK
jgi:hypothetical protein